MILWIISISVVISNIDSGNKIYFFLSLLKASKEFEWNDKMLVLTSLLKFLPTLKVRPKNQYK